MNNFSEWIAADRSWWGKLCSFVFVRARSGSGFRIRARYIQRRISNLVFRRKPFGHSPQRACGSGKKIGTARRASRRLSLLVPLPVAKSIFDRSPWHTALAALQLPKLTFLSLARATACVFTFDGGRSSTRHQTIASAGSPFYHHPTRTGLKYIPIRTSINSADEMKKDATRCDAMRYGAQCVREMNTTIFLQMRVCSSRK